MTTTIKEVLGTSATLLASSELGGLTNNSIVVSAALNSNGVYNNTQGSGSSSTSGDGYERGYVTFVPGGAFGSAPTANTSLDVYFLKSADGGSTFEGGTSSYLPARRPDVVLPLNSNTTTAAGNKVTVACFLPGCYFMILAKNNGSGQTIPSGSTLTLVPATDEGF
jgi:hypothetical protein